MTKRGRQPKLTIEYVRIGKLKPNKRSARTHCKHQFEKLQASFRNVGIVEPVIADEQYTILSGHARVVAAKMAGHTHLPVIVLRDLSDRQKRTFMLASNRIAADGGWDFNKLAIEIQDLAPQIAAAGLDFELVTGFGAAECDRLLTDFVDSEIDPIDELPALAPTAVTRAGDLWILGDHRLLCGDARDTTNYAALMNRDRAAMVFTDVPYNTSISSIVGRGKTKHREFASASGEMSDSQYQTFLTDVHGLIARHCADGAIVFSCIDWRHIGQMLLAGAAAFSELKNIVVWVKSNAGQGSFYRSQHEFVAVFKNGDSPHRNNIELGRHGRNRSNVWKFAGVNSFRAGRMEELSVHPTVKPIAMVADAMRDCTRRGDMVLDPFMGSGTTLLAAERVARRGYGIEIDPFYVDVAIRRWQQFAKRDAILAGTRKTFREIETVRSATGKRRRA